jgi:hypothetical protein
MYNTVSDWTSIDLKKPRMWREQTVAAKRSLHFRKQFIEKALKKLNFLVKQILSLVLAVV